MALLMVVTPVMAVKAQTERKMKVDELFQLVESNSKTLQQEKISVEFAQKGIEVARTARLPELSASASVAMNGDVLVMDRDFTHAQGFSAPRWGNSLVVEAQQVVYAGGAVDAGIRLARLQHEQAQVGVRSTQADQRFLARQAVATLCPISGMRLSMKSGFLAHRCWLTSLPSDMPTLATSSEWVRRLCTKTLPGRGNTCVLFCRRRKGAEKIRRS